MVKLAVQRRVLGAVGPVARFDMECVLVQPEWTTSDPRDNQNGACAHVLPSCGEDEQDHPVSG